MFIKLSVQLWVLLLNGPVNGCPHLLLILLPAYNPPDWQLIPLFHLPIICAAQVLWLLSHLRSMSHWKSNLHPIQPTETAFPCCQLAWHTIWPNEPFPLHTANHAWTSPTSASANQQWLGVSHWCHITQCDCYKLGWVLTTEAQKRAIKGWVILVVQQQWSLLHNTII
jgi:hypothetical protein